jgi:hypothetical protein
MPIDAGRIISALVEAQATVEQGERKRYRPRGNVVTLAHDLGSGGREIAERLAERLGVRYYDRQVANAILAAAAPTLSCPGTRCSACASSARPRCVRNA